jgi:serine/threonine protein kinase
MKHPSPEQLAAFGLGKLLGPSADTVVAHLETCVDCRRAVASLSADSFVGRIQAADVEATLGAVPPELANHPDYRVVCELGRGGMGVVYLARNTIMDRDEVLKVAHRALLEKPGASDRFLQEIRSAAQLMHVNVVRAYSVLRLGDLLVFAMEYVPGDDLAMIVRKQGGLPVAYACNYAAQIALGLQHAHEKGMVHRDIKPSNLILSNDGKKPVVKILDFGLAKMTSEVGFARDLTGSNKMMGTPDYIAPEQILDAAKADIRADIYSLGCTLYYLLAGSPPFAGGSLYEVLHAHNTASARPLNLVRPGVPAELAAVVAKMLAKEPRKRYQTPGDVAKELQPFTKPGAAPTPATVMPMAHPAPAPPRARRMTVGPVDARKLSRVDDRGPARFELAAKTMLESPPNRTRSPKPADKDRRAVWIGFGIAAMLGVVGLLGLLLAASGTFRVATPDGTIVLEDLPEGAEVRVDGNQMTIHSEKDDPFVIRVQPGSHKLEIRKGGFKAYTKDIALEVGERKPISGRLEPLAAAADPTPPAAAEKSTPKKTRNFEPLFNGKDLTGWSTGAGGKDKWRVEDGAIVWQYEKGSFLWTDRDDYANFHFRVEMRISNGGYAHLLIRDAFVLGVSGHGDAYHIVINNTNENPKKTGSLETGGIALNPVYESQIADNQWFLLEVFARDDRVVTVVDGRTMADYNDPQKRFARGRIALWPLTLRGPPRSIEFRKIEIKELP